VAAPTAVLINGVVADLSSETLRDAGGRAVALRPQAFATLRHMIANANRLVTKGELIEAVWRGTAVTDDSLVQCIHEIRRALNDAGHEVLQTVSRRGYRLLLPGQDSAGPSGAAGPSIAVLPFRSLGEGGLPDYFADGLVDDVITQLSKIPGLFVIARNSSFTYRERTIDARTIADELGVRYLLDGSIARSGIRLRVNAHLIEGATASHVWAGRFECADEDLFDVQDRLTEQIVGVMEPSIRRAEIERARRRRPDSPDAYDLYLRALPHAFANTVAEADRALRLLDDALRLDPGFVAAHGYAAWCREQRYFRHGFDPAERTAALEHADVATGLSSDDPQAMSIGAFVRANLTRDHDAALGVLDRALAMNGNSALAFGFSALVSAHSERDARAVAHALKALRLSPLDDPLNYHPYCALALTHLFAGRFTDAVAYAKLTIRANPGFSVAHAYLVAAHVRLGEIDAARAAARRLLEVAPSFSIRDFARMALFRAPLMEGLTASLRQVHLPEA
jgi:TolB-like protein